MFPVIQFPKLPGVPLDELQRPKGVQFNAPPEHLLPSIMGSIERAMSELPPDVDGALVGQATKAGWNAAIVMKAPLGINVEAWIGSKWGEPIDYGVAVLKTFKLPA
jgi:hypothetical protein